MINNYTDTQLKQALAKMLPDTLRHCSCGIKSCHSLHGPRWKNNNANVRDTELLHLCWLVEEGLNSAEHCHYFRQMEHEIQMWLIEQDEDVGYGDIYSWAIHATWQQRVIALAKVKGVEIV